MRYGSHRGRTTAPRNREICAFGLQRPELVEPQFLEFAPQSLNTFLTSKAD